MHIFLKYRTFEDFYDKLLLSLFLRILPNVPRQVHMLIIGSAPLFLHTFLFEGFCQLMWFTEVSRLLSFVWGEWPWTDQAKNEGSTNHASIPLCSHPLYSSHCPLSPQRLLQKLGYSCPPPSHFFLMPGNVQSNTQVVQPRGHRFWLIGSHSDIWSVASRGRILRSI